MPNTVRGTRLSTSSGNRTHSHSAFKNGGLTLRLASGRLHIGTDVGFLEVVRVVVRDRDGDRSGARASNTRPGHGRHGTRNAGSMAAGREPSLPTGVLVR